MGLWIRANPPVHTEMALQREEVLAAARAVSPFPHPLKESKSVPVPWIQFDVTPAYSPEALSERCSSPAFASVG